MVYLETCIGYNSFSFTSFSHVLVPLIQSTNKYHPFVVFLFSGACFGLCIIPYYFPMAFLSDRWSGISLNIIKSFYSASHEVCMGSDTRLANTSTPYPPGNPDSYTLVSNIGLTLGSPMSSLLVFRFLFTTVPQYYSYPLESRTYITIYSFLFSGVGSSYLSGIYASGSTGFISWNDASL